MFFSLQGQSIQSESVAYMLCEDCDIHIFFQVDKVDIPKRLFHYNTQEDCHAAYEKICELLDVQPIETHLQIDTEDTGHIDSLYRRKRQSE